MVRDLSVKLTYQDYVALPDDGRRYEIHDGELSVTPSPSFEHQQIGVRLSAILFRHVQAHGLGEVVSAPLDVILAEAVIVQPDLVYLHRTRQGAISPRGVEGPPTLVVEILSPSTTRIDRVRKLQLYARHGVPFYWIVDPEARAIEAYVLGPDGYSLALRATGAEPVSPPPFENLALVPDALWP